MPLPYEQNADLLNLLPQHEMLKGTIQQSRPLPRWLWYIIAKLVGVKIRPSEWPILGYFLLVMTFLSGLVYLTSTGVFYYFDVTNTTTNFDALGYFITVIMAFGFFFIGLYGNKLARKLFSNRVFVQSLRLHSRTVLKISAPILLSVVGLGFLVLCEVSNDKIYRDSYCKKINLPPLLCHFRYAAQIIFAFLTFLWNFLIALICFSACRTHTIAIRTFLLELDEDAMVNLLRERKTETPSNRPKSYSFSESEYNDLSPTETSPLIAGVSNRRPPFLRTRSSSELRSVVRDVLEDEWENAEYQRRVSSVSQLHPQQVFQFPARITIQNLDQSGDAFYRGTIGGGDWPELSTATGATSYSHTPSSVMLTNKDILQKYWKLQCRLMTTSLALQRWMASWILLILSWSVVYLIYWISHEASFIDMLKFCLPLFLLPLICSGVTEVNSEGQRVSRSICPMEERLSIINLFLKQPLSFTLYGYALDYSSLVTAIAAVAVAFATKIILASMNG